MHIDRIKELINSARNLGVKEVAGSLSLDDFIELCVSARHGTMTRAAVALELKPEEPPEPAPPATDWLTLRTSFESAARELVKVENTTDRARAISALAILLDVDSEVSEILTDR